MIYIAAAIVGMLVGLSLVAWDARERGRVDPYAGYLSGFTGTRAKYQTRRLKDGRLAAYTERGWRTWEPPK